jgi:signal transduction histidine kinase
LKFNNPQNFATTISLIVVYIAVFYIAAIFEYAPSASLWYAPSGLTVAILMLWKSDGFIKVWLSVFFVSVLVKYPDYDLIRVLLISTSAGFTHTVPYFLALKAFNRTESNLKSKPDRALLRPILYAFYLLIGALSAALLGIGTQMVFADMTFSIARHIWLSWWLGDYVGAIILGPVFIFIGCKYLSKLIKPENTFLIRYSQITRFLPTEKLSYIAWMLIVLLPSTIVITRIEFDDRIPAVLSFLFALLPIAILSMRNTWGTLVSSTVLSSLLIIVTVQYFGIQDNAITYQTTLLAISVTSLYFYDFARSFELRAQDLVETEHSLSMASKLLTLNEVGANIAHELSTPLQAALSSSQRVRRRLEKSNDDWSIEIDELNNIKDAINQANVTVDSVCSLVKTPQSSISYYTIDDAIQLACKLTEPKVNKHNVQVYIENTQKQMCVKIEQGELVQVLLNLISNSVRSATESIAKTVTISVELKNESLVFIKVTDSGKGVDELNVRNLFKFGHSKSNDGLGLGLWTSKSIAERQGGALEYIHAADDSWCFRLTLRRLEREQQ